MKRIALFTLTALLLAACNSGLTVADKDVLKTYPELEGTIWAWQSMVDSAAAEDCEAFLENMRITLNLTEEVCPAAFAYFEETPILVETAINEKFKVIYTEPAEKGDTSGRAYKSATINTGATVMVPLFINTNDTIVVNTDTGFYVERG